MHARINDIEVANVNVHDMLKEEHMSLHAHVAAIKNNMWASKVELVLSAKVLGSAIAYKTKKGMETLGEGRLTRCVVLRHGHYTLSKLHRDLDVNPTHEVTKHDYQRAGMES